MGTHNIDKTTKKTQETNTRIGKHLLKIVCKNRGCSLDGYLDDLQIVAWNQAGTSGRGRDFSFPPAVILKSEHGKNVSLGEAQFLGDRCGVTVHCTGCR